MADETRDLVEEIRLEIAHHREQIATTDPRFVSDEWVGVLAMLERSADELARMHNLLDWRRAVEVEAWSVDGEWHASTVQSPGNQAGVPAVLLLPEEG